MSKQRLACVVLAFGLLTACGDSGTKSSGSNGYPLDLSGDDNLNFYSATGSFVSATFYNLNIGAGVVKRYKPTASDTLEVDQQRTMSTDNKANVTEELKSLYATSFGQCAAEVCSKGRPQHWIGVMDNNPPSYYFAYQGDCSCPDDGKNVAVLKYATLSALFAEVKGSL